MAAYYPSNVKSWTQRTDLTDVVMAADVNTIYSEVTAIETYLGANLHISDTWGTGSVFDTATVIWGSIKARLQNVENGLYEVYADRVKTSGGSIVKPSGTTTVNLTLQAKASQTAAELLVQDSSGANIYSFGPDAGSFTGVIDGGTP
jgi:hypothetical protein